MSQPTPTRGDSGVRSAYGTRFKEPNSNTIKATAVSNIPIPIFRGVDGSILCFLHQAKSPTTTGVKITINDGLKGWNNSGENGLTSLNEL